MHLNRYAIFAWATLLYNILVILWGAFVRATGSGAGCGSHWPLCNGVVVPHAPEVATIIEFTHRLTSGVALLLVLALFVWARRAYPTGHIVRLGAALSLIFIIIEALVGAALVVLQLVADNISVARAVWMAAHLLNTFFLLGVLTLTAWWASGGAPLRFKGQGLVATLLGIGIVGMLFLGMSGAVTALGDTLFPSTSLVEGIREDFSPTAHFLVRLRVFHPLIAITTGLYLLAASVLVTMLRPDRATKLCATALAVLFVIQLGVGMVNLALMAPVALQIIHLLMADLIWIVLIILTATALAAPAPARLTQPVPHEVANLRFKAGD
jgi:heme A synthase